MIVLINNFTEGLKLIGFFLVFGTICTIIKKIWFWLKEIYEDILGGIILLFIVSLADPHIWIGISASVTQLSSLNEYFLAEFGL